jgi:hypothetical protein
VRQVRELKPIAQELNMHLPRSILPGALLSVSLLFAPPSARADQVGEQTFVETFESGTNEGGWTFGTGNEFLAADIGDPGVCVFDASLITYAPRASTSFGVSSVFTGDWAARGVVRIGIDLATAWAEANMGERPITVILLNDNNTPYDLEDDWGAYFVSTQLAPQPGAVAVDGGTLSWSKYEFEVPAREHQLPPGWGWIARNTIRPNGGWKRLMGDVSQVAFMYGDITKLYLVFGYQVALDNPRITVRP